MPPPGAFTRRGFVLCSSAAAAASAIDFPLQAQSTPQATGRPGEFVVPPPKTITGATRPLLAGNTARPLRYRPVDGDFVIRNGREFFNRPLYGPNINFRVDAGDLPEFSLYLPGHGGNLKLGLSAARGSKWLAQAPEVITRYRPGRMIYEVRERFAFSGSSPQRRHSCRRRRRLQTGVAGQRRAPRSASVLVRFRWPQALQQATIIDCLSQH